MDGILCNKGAAKLLDVSCGGGEPKSIEFGFFRIFKENKRDMYENRPRK